jgi:hypothetical protein
MKIKLAFAVVALLALNTAFSQVNKTEYELIKDQFKLEKKAIVAEVLNLKGAEETNFWPLYNAYEEERTKISKGSWDLLEKYASRYDSLSGAEAQSMVTKSIAINQQLLKLRYNYLKTMSQKVSPATAARFIQLEDYLYTLLRSELFENVPIFGQLKK